MPALYISPLTDFVRTLHNVRDRSTDVIVMTSQSDAPAAEYECSDDDGRRNEAGDGHRPLFRIDIYTTTTDQTSMYHTARPIMAISCYTSYSSPTDSNRRRLRSSSSSHPTYTAVHCWRSCVSGGWKPPLDSLPPDATSAPTPTVFRNRLKTHLFSRSFPSWLFSVSSSVHLV